MPLQAVACFEGNTLGLAPVGARLRDDPGRSGTRTDFRRGTLARISHESGNQIGLRHV